MTPKVLVLADLTPPYDRPTFLEEEVTMIRESGVLTTNNLIKRVLKDPLIRGLICPLGQKIDATVFRELPQLEVVSNVAVGLDNIDLESAKRNKVKVSHTPFVLTESTADLAWALLLGGSRRLVEGDRLARSGRWKGWGMNQLLGQSLGSLGVGSELTKSLGVIGLGSIGESIARRSIGFNMDLFYYNRTRKPLLESEYGWVYLELDELVQRVDFLVLALALTPDTFHILNEERLQKMKPNAYLVNIGRGALVDEDALIRVLERGHLSGAGLDVYEREPFIPERLRQLSQVTLSPHLGSATLEARRAMSRLSIESVVSVLLGIEERGYFKIT